MAAINPWRTTDWASCRRPAPMSWAIWTEKPAAAETQTPPKSHVVLATRPMAAVALAPREPTMAASIYCMAMPLISARMAGTLRRSTSPICCQRVVEASG